jgi:hypothetical protein
MQFAKVLCAGDDPPAMPAFYHMPTRSPAAISSRKILAAFGVEQLVSPLIN